MGCHVESLNDICNCPSNIDKINMFNPLLVKEGQKLQRLIGGQSKPLNIPQCLINKKFPQVTSLNLGYSHLGSVDIASIFPQVTELNLSDNHLKIVDGKKLPPYVTSLVLDNNPIEQLDNIDSLKYLTRLSVQNARSLKRMSGIERVNNLNELNLTGNPHLSLNSKWGAFKINNLSKKLDRNEIMMLKSYLRGEIKSKIDGNNFYGICASNNAPNMILLNDFQLKKIPACLYSNKAKIIDLSNNNLVSPDLTLIEHYGKMKELFLRNNGISKINEINGLNVLDELEILDLSNNKISTLTPATNPNILKNLKNLKKINLSNNNLLGMSGIEGLVYLKNLDHLDLTGNPNLPHITCKNNPLIPRIYDGREIQKLIKCISKGKYSESY